MDDINFGLKHVLFIKETCEIKVKGHLNTICVMRIFIFINPVFPLFLYKMEEGHVFEMLAARGSIWISAVKKKYRTQC